MKCQKQRVFLTNFIGMFAPAMGFNPTAHVGQIPFKFTNLIGERCCGDFNICSPLTDRIYNLNWATRNIRHVLSPDLSVIEVCYPVERAAGIAYIDRVRPQRFIAAFVRPSGTVTAQLKLGIKIMSMAVLGVNTFHRMSDDLIWSK
jgi:hypothetical protein